MSFSNRIQELGRTLLEELPRRETVAAPVLALLLLTTAMASPAVGVAAAASSSEECSGIDALIYDSVTVGEWSLADQQEHPCSPKYQRAQAIQEMQNASAEQEKLDIYNAALTQKSNNEVFTDVSDNYLNDSRSIAWMKAETAIAQAYANNSSKAVAKSKAKTAIRNYYAKKQVNMIERWNVSLRTHEELNEVAVQSGISKSFVSYDATSGGSQIGWGNVESYDNSTMQLVNGSSHGVRTVILSLRDAKEFYPNTGVHVDDEDNHYRGLRVDPPTSEDDGIRYVSFASWKSNWGKTETLNTDLQNEVDPFVNATWTAFQNGKISASDVISRNNLMFRYGTDALNNSNQSLYDSTAALSTMGLATPSINSTGSMTVEYQNVSYEGMVLAQEAPNGSWQTGTTYNTENIGGTVLLATTDGQRIDMEGEFTLASMKNQDGDEIQETQATKVVYKTSNTSELLAKMDQIIELRKQIEATKPKPGGGGTSDGGGNSGLLKKLAAALGVSAGAALVVLAGAAIVVLKIYSP